MSEWRPNSFKILGITSYSNINTLEGHCAKCHILFTKWTFGPLKSSTTIKIHYKNCLRNFRTNKTQICLKSLHRWIGNKKHYQFFPIKNNYLILYTSKNFFVTKSWNFYNCICCLSFLSLKRYKNINTTKNQLYSSQRGTKSHLKKHSPT